MVGPEGFQERLMPYCTIEIGRDGAVATLRLNRPERMNAVIEAMYEEIQDALGSFETDDRVRCLILTGSVLRRDGVDKQAFCAGADLKQHSAGERSAEQRRAYIELAHETCRRLYQFPKPVIAAVNGPARGAGTELALCCDLILIAGDATVALPEVGLGTFVGGGATRNLPRLVGLARAKELVLTGRVINGREAVDLGLALASFPVARLLEEAHDLASRLARQAPVSMAFAKRLLQRSPDLNLGTVLELEAEAILTCMETDDWHEGLRAFTERRPPDFKGK
jgi:enoyl-CoA hydratase